MIDVKKVVEEAAELISSVTKDKDGYSDLNQVKNLRGKLYKLKRPLKDEMYKLMEDDNVKRYLEIDEALYEISLEKERKINLSR